ncbi:MAG: hypothetical protein AMJ92_00855 [candidate division Zixibacteria bacterium SM23_81]|nr:MAG: hypothetical protein AMJ92_00855 [candidate division Zixibacteria bacterium SM23_81]
MAHCWLVVGNPQNWVTAFEHGNIWGLKVSQQRLWEGLQENDVLLFYATNPVSGIIGYGRVRTKFRQNQPLWPQEIKENRIIWPLRFEFDVDYCLPPDKWKARRLDTKDLFVRAGFQLLDLERAEQLISTISNLVAAIPPSKPSMTRESAEEYSPPDEKPEEVLPNHNTVQEALVEIGRLQSFIAESEYPFDFGRLDVVWRRVEKSVPTYVYEIQMSGNLYQALTKLKHAYDLWNSHVFFVSPQKQLNTARHLLDGSFHEVRDRLKFIDCLKVEELLVRKRSYSELERELGILE